MASRAKEIEFMLSFLEEPEVLLEKMRRSRSGGVCVCEGIRFEFGRVGSLLKHINFDQHKSTSSDGQKFKPRYVFHLDGLSKQRKIAIEVKHKLKEAALSSDKIKADLLLVSGTQKASFISYKDSSTSSKIGQVSQAKYGKAKLLGGLSKVVLPSENYPAEILRSQTGLNAKQWKSLKTAQDKRFAYVKKQLPKAWSKIVREDMADAYQQLGEFGKVIKSDRNSLIKFVKLTLAGDSADATNFYVVFGDQIINVQHILRELKKPTVVVSTEIRKTANKKSLLVFVKLNGKKYCLTKIEPSFEGAAVDVSQTKGIIFHFQQYPLKNTVNAGDMGSFKDLLRDMCE